MALLAPWAANAQTTVTIGDLTTATNDSYLPMNSLYEYSYTQQIYEACEIGTAGTINSITIWMYGNANLYEMPFDIYMVETDKDAFTSTSDWVSVTSSDIVYSGSVTVHNTTAEAYTFTLTTPFEFSGRNNLVIAFDNNTGNWKSGLNGKVSATADGYTKAIYARRDGTDYDPTAMSGITAYGTIAKRNVITFDITPDPSVIMCCPVQNLKAEDVEAYTARLTWESDATDFVVEYKKSTDETWTTATANGNEAQLSRLTPETYYNARVKVDCGGGDYSVEKTVNFTTDPSCFVPTGFGRTDLTYQSVTLNWTSEADAWDVMLVTVAADATNNDTTIIAVRENPYTLTGLTAEQAYKARVRANCGSQDGVSAWTSFTSFTTPSACVTPTNLTCTALTATTATLSWFEAGNSREWEVLYILGQDSTRVRVTENPYTLTGLTTEGAYTARVRATCAETETWSNAATFEPTEKWVIGAATTTHTTLPANNYYNYSLSEQIYTAAELGEAAAIFSIDFYKANTTEMVKDLVIYIVNTNKTKFENATDWIPVTAADIYYQGQVTFANNAWTTITLDVPFAYDGTSNLAIVVDNNTGSFKSSTPFRCYTATANQSLCQQSDTENLDPTAATVGTGALTTAKNMIRLVKGEMPSCLAPNGVTCTAVTANSATLDWSPNGNETEWVIQYSTDAEFATFSEATANAHPFELTGLTAETVYYARVKAGCDSDWSAVCTFMPTARITIGEGIATSGYVPGYFFYNYSYSEQIYTVAELGDAAMIESIDFYCASSPTMSRTFEIYMVSTDKSAFTGTAKAADWIPVTAGDKVCTKSLLLTQGWNTFELDNPFLYDGTKNIAIVVCTAADENYESSISFRVFDATAQALYVQNDNSAYDPTNPSEYSGTLLNVKNQIRILKGEVPSCFQPSALAVVGEPGNHSVVLDWTENNEATEWVVAYSPDGENFSEMTTTTKPFTLTGLRAETEYFVKVRSNCSADDHSAWSSVLSFTTDVACPAPTNLTIEPTPFSATVAWTSDNDNFDVWYRELTDPNNDFEASSLKAWTTIDADGDGYTWVLGSKCGGIYLVEGGSLAGSGHESSNDFVTSGSYSNVSGVGALEPDNYLVSPQINLGGSITFWASAQDADWAAEHFGVAVSTTVNNDATAFTTIQEWDMTAKGTGAKMNPGTTRSGNRAQGAWYEYTVDLSEYAGQTGYVAIRHFDCTDNFLLNVDDITIVQPNYVEPEWIQETANDTVYTITGLTARRAYEVQVRSNCGDEGVSLWAYDMFVTPAACDAPSGLEATNVEATSATLNWTAFEGLDYNVRYRTAAFQTTYFEDDFDETQGTSWTQIDGYTNYYWQGTSDFFVLMGYEGTENRVYLISPELTGEYEEGSFLYFAYRHFPEVTVPDSAMVFNVGYSTTTADLDAFTWGDEITSAYSWTEFEEEIPVGTKYFAIQTTDAFEGVGLVLDYFGVYAPAVEAGEWVDVENATSPLDIAGLNPETLYEWQVQGVNCDGEGGTTEWSETDYFTTLEITNVTQTITLAGGDAAQNMQGFTQIAITVDITLDDLKAALIAAMPGVSPIVIYSESGSTTYNGSRWRGSLTSLDLSQMFVIQVPASQGACELVLTGEPVDPAEHPITINPASGSDHGYTWFGYPFDESMTIANAFAGFAVPGDAIHGLAGSTTFNGSRWRGSITTLEPGQGYIYESASTENRPFVFPSSAKKQNQQPRAGKKLPVVNSRIMNLCVPSKSIENLKINKK